MAEQDKKKEEAPEEEANKAKKGRVKKKYAIIGGIVGVVLLIQITTAFLFVRWIKGKDPAIETLKKLEAQKREEVERLTSIGAVLEEPISVTVNIAGSDGEHYLKSTLQLEWDESEYGGLRESLEMRRAKINDIIISILSTQSKEDLTLASGKERTRESIRGEINRILPKKDGRIANVFFQEFIIQ